ncbi:hypothetical protein L210DRAFT_950485 [Boletus edulis BED1]|uniref:Uncharacterized protein n=1 Tax=Boletus edulis BED1 TaxID=1328754 RepID=A0AAD4G9D2_BOLED|nr:hypothetical protein L210DRAFT_950485 [Boletus edulis BED1]
MRSLTRRLCNHAQPSAIPLSSLTLSQVEADAHLTSSHALSLLQGCRAPMPSLLPSLLPDTSRVSSLSQGCCASDAQPSAHHPPPSHCLR